MQLWFAKKRKECPRCESSVVRRAYSKGFHERFVHPLLFVWPYERRDYSIRFLGFPSRYARPYVKPHFRLAKPLSASSPQ
jgi:hypothetical protein